MPSAKAASTSIPDSADLSSHANLTVALGSTTIALAAFFLLARLYSNRYLTRSIGYDDCEYLHMFCVSIVLTDSK